MSGKKVKTAETNGRGVVHVPPGESEAIWASGNTYTLKGTAENTGGSLLLTESVVLSLRGFPHHIPHPPTREQIEKAVALPKYDTEIVLQSEA